jgi:hypothetical protein
MNNHASQEQTTERVVGSDEKAVSLHRAAPGKHGNVFGEACATRDGGGLGSILGLNSFRRPREHACRP